MEFHFEVPRTQMDRHMLNLQPMKLLDALTLILHK